MIFLSSAPSCWVTPQQFGPAGNGVPDSTQALQLALNSGAPVWLGSDTYTVRVDPSLYENPEQGHALRLLSRRGLHVVGAGARVKMNSDTHFAGRTAILRLTAVSDVCVEGVIFDGNRSGRQVAGVGGSSCVDVIGGSQITFSRCGFVESCMDGLVITALNGSALHYYPQHVSLIDCWADRCYRSGVGLIAAKYVRIHGGRYSGSAGTDPQAGIDVEPNGTDLFGVSNLAIRDVDFSDNKQFGLALTGSFPASAGRTYTYDTQVTGISGRNNGWGLLGVFGQDISVTGLRITDDSTPPARHGYVEVGRWARRVTLKALYFTGIAGSNLDKALVHVDNSDDGTNPRHVLDGLRADNFSCAPLRLSDPFLTLRNVDLPP